MEKNAFGETVHKVGARVRHAWLGESGVVVRSWLAAMIVRRDDGSTCQVSHRDWVAVDTEGGR